MTALGVGAMLVNGYDLSAQGLAVSLWPGALGVPDTSVETEEISGRAGQIIMGSEVTAGARTITVSGTLVQTSLAAREAAWAAITRRLTGLLELRFLDRPGQFIMARCTGASLDPGRSWQGTSRGGRVALTFTADDPYFYDVNPEVVALATTAHPVPLGDAPQTGLLTLAGPATDPFVVYRDAAGVVRQTLAFGISGSTLTLGSADALVCDLSTAQVTLVQSGVQTDGAPYVLSGDLPTLDPADADPDAPAWPTLEVDDTTRAVTGIYVGRRAWR